MRRHQTSYRTLLSVLLAGLSAFGLALSSSAQGVNSEQAAQSAVAKSATAPAGFDLRSAGYVPLPNANILSNGSYFSMDFIDADHLLVTFKKPGLVKRLKTCPTTHTDHLVRAVVYELSAGKVIKEAEWYMHDGRRYLWPLGSGRFLLRKGDQLYKLDGELNEKLVFESRRELAWVDVTPDGKQIIVETKNDATAASQDKKSRPGAYQVRFLDADTLAPQREIQGRELVRFQGTSSGYPDLVRGGGNIWLVRFGPDSKIRNYVARVKSPCTPSVLFPTVNTLFIGRCSSLSRYSVSMFTVTGTRLWRQRWDDLRDVPSVSRSDDGSRFAISTVHHLPIKHITGPGTGDIEEDPQTGIEQVIQVFETATGSPVGLTKVSPVFIAGQNFSLSPDGTELAVLRGSRVEFQRFAPASAEEKAKYLAVKADVPGLVAASEDEGDESADADELALTQVETGAAGGPVPADTSIPTPQAVSEAGAPIMTLKKTATSVLVDVVVLDNKGNPVQGLTRDDFTVKEDGVVQRVRYFEDHKTEKKVEPTAPVERPANVFSNAGENVNANSVTVILYDLLNTPAKDQPYALAQLTQYLKSKPKDVRAALFTLTYGLRMISGFTEDESTLLAATQNKKNKLSGALVGRSDGLAGYDNLMARLQSQSGQFNRSGPAAGPMPLASPRPGDPVASSIYTELLEQNQAQQQERDQALTDMKVQYTLDAFAQLARYLSSIPGRKNVIWLSSSFPMWISPDPRSGHPFILARDYSNEIKKTVNLFTAAQVAVYPVNLSGLTASAAFDLSDNSDPAGISGFTDPSFASSDRATMRQIAEGTGGKAFVNTNGIKDAIQESVQQSTAFYTVSYSPTNTKYDGRFRNIKVDLAQRGYKLQYRTGYFSEDPDQQKKVQDLARDLEIAAVQPGSPDLRQIPMLARVVPMGEPFKADATQFMSPAERKKAAKKGTPTTTMAQRYAVDYAIPAARLRFDPTPDGNLHGVFNFMLTAFDPTGGVIARAGQAAKSDIAPENYKELLAAGYRMHQELDVPTTAMALRLAVQDATAGNLATLEVGLPVPPLPDFPRRKGRKALPEVEPD